MAKKGGEGRREGGREIEGERRGKRKEQRREGERKKELLQQLDTLFPRFAFMPLCTSFDGKNFQLVHKPTKAVV